MVVAGIMDFVIYMQGESDSAIALVWGDRFGKTRNCEGCLGLLSENEGKTLEISS